MGDRSPVGKDSSRVPSRVSSRGAPSRPRGAWELERPVVLALLALHLGLVTWGLARNSVTFDENFHLPAGVAIVARRDFDVSYAQPPLVKSVCALAALAAGARVPPPQPPPPHAADAAGLDFDAANA